MRERPRGGSPFGSTFHSYFLYFYTNQAFFVMEPRLLLGFLAALLLLGHAHAHGLASRWWLGELVDAGLRWAGLQAKPSHGGLALGLHRLARVPPSLKAVAALQVRGRAAACVMRPYMCFSGPISQIPRSFPTSSSPAGRHLRGPHGTERCS